jgi:hypothetical protein
VILQELVVFLEPHDLKLQPLVDAACSYALLRILYAERRSICCLQYVVELGDCALVIAAITGILTAAKRGVCLVKAMLRMIKYVFALKLTAQHQPITHYCSTS